MVHEKDFIQKLGTFLIELGVMTELSFSQVQKQFQGVSQDNFIDFLVEEGLVTTEDLLQTLSMYYKVPAFDVRGVFFEPFFLRKFPKDMLHRHVIIPYTVDGDIMIMIAAHPNNAHLLVEIGKYVSYDIQFNVGLQHDIVDAIDEYYDESDTSDYAQEKEEEISDVDADVLF